MEYTTSQETKILLKINGIYSFALFLGGIFLQVFLFTLGGFRALVEYNLVSAGSLLIFYFLSGWILTRVRSKNLLLFGISAYILLFSLLFLFREQSLSLLAVLGAIHGMATGIFWGVMNLLHYVFITQEARHRFFGRQSFLFSITGGVAPILGGMLISLMGFLVSKEFGYSFVFFLVAVLMALVYHQATKLPEQKVIDFSLHDMTKHRRSHIWKSVLLQDFFAGMFDAMFPAFSAVIIFLIVKEEFVLGFVNAAGAIIAACAGLSAGIILAKKQTSFIVASFIAAFGIGLFAWQQNWWGLIALTFLFNAAMPVIGVASSKTFFDVMDRLGRDWQKKYYLFLEREIALGLGRVSSLLLFLLAVSDRNQLEIARIAIGLLAFVPLCIGFFLMRIMRVMRIDT